MSKWKANWLAKLVSHSVKLGKTRQNHIQLDRTRELSKNRVQPGKRKDKSTGEDGGQLGRIHIVFNSCTRNSSSPSEMTPGSGSPLENLPLKRPELWREPRSSLLSSLVLDDRFSLSIFLPVPLPIDSLIEKKNVLQP